MLPRDRAVGKGLALAIAIQLSTGSVGEERDNAMQQTGKDVELPLSSTDMIIDF